MRESTRPVTWLAVVNAAEQPRSYEERMAAVADLTAWDMAVPQTTCRPLRFQLNLANPYILGVFPTWQPVMRLSREQKLARYADPAFRQAFRDDLKNIPAFGKDIWSRFYVLDGISDQARALAKGGQSLRQLADAQTRDPMDLLVEIAVEDELRTTFDMVALNYDAADTIPLVRDDRLLIGLSDAGAHLDMLCDAGYSTHLLQRWVRETGALTLEQGVQKAHLHPGPVLRHRPRRAGGRQGGRPGHLRSGHRRLRRQAVGARPARRRAALRDPLHRHPRHHRRRRSAVRERRLPARPAQGADAAQLRRLSTGSGLRPGGLRPSCDGLLVGGAPRAGGAAGRHHAGNVDRLRAALVVQGAKGQSTFTITRMAMIRPGK